MPKADVKRVAVARSTPVSIDKRKCIKVTSENIYEKSGSQSDVITLSSSDESPVKEKRIIDLRSITPGLTITTDQTSTPMSPTDSTSSKIASDNPNCDDPPFPGVIKIKNHFVAKPGLKCLCLDKPGLIFEEQEDEKQEDEEMESEEEFMERRVALVQPEFDEELEPEFKEDEEEEISPEEDKKCMPKFNRILFNNPKNIILNCRSIRIGSHKIYPIGHSSLQVTVTEKSIHFVVPFITSDAKADTPLLLTAQDVESMLIHFGKCLPIIFVKTTEGFGEYVKKTLNLKKSLSEEFMPKSDDIKRNKLIFLIDTLKEEQRTFMRQIFPGPEKLEELSQTEANKLLVKSTPPPPPNYLKRQR